MKKRVFFAAALALICIVLEACSAEPTEPLNMAVINAICSNSVSIDPNDLISTVNSVCEHDGHYSYIIADGNPFLAAQFDIKIKRNDAMPDTINRHINSEKERVMEKLDACGPRSEEVDMMAALKIAAATLKGRENPIITIYGNGLSTCGALDMTNLNLDSSVANIDVTATVEALKASSTIPDLSGCTVYFYFCDVDGLQKPLSSKEQLLIETLWQKIVEAGGGVFVPEYLYTSSSESTADYPYVTPIIIKGEKNNVESSAPIPTTEEDHITIDEETVSFIPNTADFIDQDAAMTAIAPFAESFVKNNTEVILIGSTAHVGEEESSFALSEARAKAVARLLIENGVPETSIVACFGMGYSEENPFYTPDLDESGQLIESIAATNRKVVIIDKNSDTAAAFLE